MTLNWGRNLLHLHVVQRSKFGSFRKWLIFRRKTGDGLWSWREIKHVIWVMLFGQLPKKSDGMIGMMNVFIALEDMIHTFQFWGSTGCSPNWVQKIAESRDYYDWHETTTAEWFFGRCRRSSESRGTCCFGRSFHLTSALDKIMIRCAFEEETYLWQLPFVQP